MTDDMAVALPADRRVAEVVTGTAKDVIIRLSRAKALVLFEWAHRFMETQDSRFTHPADPIAVHELASVLEWALPELFTAEYPSLLAASRARVEAEYRAALGPRDAGWLDFPAYQDVQPQRYADPGAAPDIGRM